jgi:hypothetical protein
LKKCRIIILLFCSISLPTFALDDWLTVDSDNYGVISCTFYLPENLKLIESEKKRYYELYTTSYRSMDKAETELVKLRRIFEKHYDADSTVLKSLQIDFKVVKTESKYGVFYRLKTVTSNQKRPIEHVRRLFQEKAGIKGLIF